MQASLTPELLALPERIKKASGLHADLVTTPDEQWAVQVFVGNEKPTPIAAVERIASPYRVLYRSNPSPMVARPAIPSLGE